jgi:hypothetical protein
LPPHPGALVRAKPTYSSRAIEDAASRAVPLASDLEVERILEDSYVEALAAVD